MSLSTASTPPLSTPSAQFTILVWGDSLSAAYGIPVAQGWVQQLKNALGTKATIINRSISGETTQGGLSRLPQALAQDQPKLVILELGANDGLRGQPIVQMQHNLQQMIELAQAAQAKVVLLGMKLPPNYGLTYTQQFEAVYAQLAQHYQLPFVPFVLQAIAEDFSLMQADGIHPTAAAQSRILEAILPTLNPLIP